jgi:hypothetical protein
MSQNNLQCKIVQASRAGVSPKAIAKFVNLPLAEVKVILAQAERQRLKQAELAQWSALIGHHLL